MILFRGKNLGLKKNGGAIGDLGFTLIEIMVVMSIVAILSGVIFANFRVPSKNATARKQVASVVLSSIRRAQSLTLSGSGFGGSEVCGYGVHYVSEISYLIFAKIPPVGGCSSVVTRNYQVGIDGLAETISLTNPNMKFVSQFQDVYFEAPDPKVYINNVPLSASPSNPASTTVYIGLNTQLNCTDDPCDSIKIYNSGKIDTN